MIDKDHQERYYIVPRVLVKRYRTRQIRRRLKAVGIGRNALGVDIRRRAIRRRRPRRLRPSAQPIWPSAYELTVGVYKSGAHTTYKKKKPAA